MRGDVVAPFNDLQQRLNRKKPSPKALTEHPAHLRLYDMLQVDGEDLRALTLSERKQRLAAWLDTEKPERMDLSEEVKFKDFEQLKEMYDRIRMLQSGASPLQAGGEEKVGFFATIEGFMLKRRDAPYIAGRPRGYWYKWKREPLSADVVMLYAQRGHGKRSSYYSDYTFGAWAELEGGERQLVPVGKAYSGFTDAELLKLDKWIRAHTTERLAPYARWKKPWCWRWVLIPSTNPTAINPAWPCASPASCACAGINPPRRPIRWKD